MKWKEDSLKAFGIYRWLLRAEESGMLKLELLTNPILKDFTAGVEQLELDDIFYEIKDKIFALFQLNKEQFFVYLPLEKKTHTVTINDLLDFLTIHESDSPSWWPSHFASPADCDLWVEGQLAKMMHPQSES